MNVLRLIYKNKTVNRKMGVTLNYLEESL